MWNLEKLKTGIFQDSWQSIKILTQELETMIFQLSTPVQVERSRLRLRWKNGTLFFEEK